MKTIELEDDLYRYIASETKDIGESASDILRRLLNVPGERKNSVPEVAVPQRDITDTHSPIEQTVAKPQPKSTPTPMPAVVSNSALPSNIDKLIKSKQFAEITVSVTKFIQILSVLYAENPAGFDAATAIKGRKRIYFAKSESELLSSGSTTKPRKIENTPYWVITNTNTGRKRNIVTQLMAEMGFPHAMIDAVSQSI